MQAIDVEAGDVDIGLAGGDPVSHDAAESAAGQDADGVQACGNEVVLDLWCFADNGQQIRGERLGAAEELAHAGLKRDGHAGHRLFEIRAHAIPVGRQFTKAEVTRNAVDLPRGADRLEQADHQAVALRAVVAIGGWVFEDRQRRIKTVDAIGDQVVVLTRLQRDRDSIELTELACPHTRAVHDVVALDVAELSLDSDHAAVLGEHLGSRDTFDELHTLHACALGQRHRDVDRVHSSVFLHVEAGLEVVNLRGREEFGDLGGGDLVHVDTKMPVERCDSAVLLKSIVIGGGLDEADWHEAGG